MPNINDLAKLLGMTPGEPASDVDDIDLDFDNEPTPSALERLENEPEEDEPDEEPERKEVLFISPDDLYHAPNSDEAVTFAYGPIAGLIYGNGSYTHYNTLNSRYRELQRDEDTPDEILEEIYTMIKVLDSGKYYDYIFGRLGTAHQRMVNRRNHLPKQITDPIQRMVDEEAQIIAFWNENEDEYEEHYTGCMRELYRNDLIREPAYVSTPINGISEIGASAPTAKGGKTAVDLEQLKLLRQLHLMRGDEKKRAMEKLGLGFKGEKQGMQTAMRNAGLIGPGQKWWAPHSESAFARKLDTILESI